ncbi:ATP-binding protein [Streptomyces sp. N2-109]|uniref:histidine kinase n=1 Tax=Streptomyces gossypii TaxID=2883101 RepID=A0ABT2JUX5_9ACTN|nr:ATP-binding protein [Streptomyces gossypii]MCT2591690.1 ATP-binding protein [Streptomyces gossypii]
MRTAAAHTAPAHTAVVPSSSPEPRARHGRSSARETAGDAVVRRRMVRLAVLPTAIVAVLAAAVVAYVMQAQGTDGGGTADAGGDGATLWGVLAGSLLVTCAVVVGAGLFASSEARTTLQRYTALRRSSERSQSELRAQLHRLEQGERPQPSAPRAGQPAPVEPSGDALDLLAHELTLAQRTAETAVLEAAALVRAGTSGSEEKVEVFVNLARRLQSLVHREIELLDELENEVEDPDLLKGLFHVDHLATRIRRHAENLAVLGGAVSRRQWTRPVTMTEVLRSSIAEVEQYSRVKLVPPIEGTLRGHAVADVIHLLAELVENASVFSAPQTQVLLRAQHVTAGLAVEVEDRGLGMDGDEQARMNELLSDPEQFDVGELLSDGRIGLFVVSALARRHGIVVQLQSNIYGGIQAVLVLPQVLLGDPTEGAKQAAAPAQSAVNAAAQMRAERAELSHVQEHQRATAAQSDAQARTSGSHGGQPQQARPQQAQPPQTQVHQTQPLPAQQIPQQTYAPQQPPAVRQPYSAPQEAPLPEAVRPSPPQPPAQHRPPEPMAAHGSAGQPAGYPPGPGPIAPAPPGPVEGLRPQLPKRRRQEHLVAELREPPRVPAATSPDDPDAGHDPGLMAAFRRGTSLADSGDGDPSAQEGDTPRPTP